MSLEGVDRVVVYARILQAGRSGPALGRGRNSQVDFFKGLQWQAQQRIEEGLKGRLPAVAFDNLSAICC